MQLNIKYFEKKWWTKKQGVENDRILWLVTKWKTQWKMELERQENVGEITWRRGRFLALALG